MNSAQLIERLGRFYQKKVVENKDKNRKYVFLITGKWGIGKTYSYNKFVEENVSKDKRYKYSLFGMKDLKELERELIKESFAPTFEKFNQSGNSKAFWQVAKGLLGAATGGATDKIMPSEVLKVLSLKNLEYEGNSIVCFDDFERCDIPMKDLMGFMERLKQKTNIVILCNEEEIKGESKETYDKYKEKVINFNYELSEVTLEVIKGMLDNLSIEEEIKENLVRRFEVNGDNNIRNIEKLVNLMEELLLDLGDLTKINVAELLRVGFIVVCNEELDSGNTEVKEEDIDLLRYRVIKNYKKGDKKEVEQIKELFRKDDLLKIEKKLARLDLYNESECKRQLEEIENSIKSIRIKKVSGVRLARLIISHENWNRILNRSPKVLSEIYIISEVIRKDFDSSSLFLFYEDKTKEEIDEILKIQARIVKKIKNQMENSFYIKLNERLKKQEYDVIVEEIKNLGSVKDFTFIGKLLNRTTTNEEYNFIYRACYTIESFFPNQREELVTFIKQVEIEDKVLRKRKDDLLKKILNKKRISNTISSYLDGVPIELEEKYKNYLNDDHLKIS